MPFQGGIKDKLELKFLILFVMKHVNQPVTHSDMMDMILCDESVNYFELCEAIPELVASGHLERLDDGSGEKYLITRKGRETAEICEDSLSKSLKKAAQKSVFSVLSRMRRDSDVTAELIGEDSGELKVRCVLNDGMGIIMSLELMVTNKQQGSRFVTNFKKNAEFIYGNVINAMLSDYKSDTTEEGDI